ncbi:serine/threonine protein kinase [Telmatocola sphagniphila]|uniref:Serine/threonine protein kinase n=1 Tax=Telmatocola sphagniphila TaxID=1123043 RepID=A0A8E6EZM3_9BACT|nr:serine/threonine-protein kinase [Telmatocola sphagniphila]QVL33626.1 serine/threonine protein kinase [Telmatocola sphagniphila]
MSVPQTPAEFVALVEKSELIDKFKLADLSTKLNQTLPQQATPSEIAAFFVKEGLLTVFQTKLLLQGKWRNFFIGSKYKVLEHIGAGGMGTVFLCEHRHMKRRVAVKLLPVEKSLSPGNIERFVREAQAVARLDHPNIVRAHDVDRDGPVYYLVMEFVDGISLQNLVDHIGPLSVERAVNYVAQASAGLQHAFLSGLVHRDIKPSNLLLERTGQIKILDLGLAKFSQHSERLTRQLDSNQVMGTADYLAPEQARDSCVDIRADIYSLGALFYFLLTGQPPFNNGSVAQKLIYHQSAIPRPVFSLRPNIAEDLSKVIDRMLAKNADDRFQTPWEVVEALNPWLRDVPPPTEEELPANNLLLLRSASSMHQKSTVANLAMTIRDRSSRGTTTANLGKLKDSKTMLCEQI